MVGHVAPEAAKGGPIGRIKDGDRIKIDVEKRTIDVKAKLASRPWTPKKPNYPNGAYAKYAALVGSASEGAVTSFPFSQTEKPKKKRK
jgi:dihydroxy-acid dehydratase